MHSHYVRPDNPSSPSCPDSKECFTLDHYGSEAALNCIVGFIK